MDKPKVSVVVTDIDNTLYDQLHVWHTTFNAMMGQLTSISGLTREAIEAEIKPIYKRAGTSEYAYLVEELPCLVGESSKVKSGSRAEAYAAAVEAYRRAQTAELHLYPLVKETLEAIKEAGCAVVAYTEAQGFYAEHRVKAMGLDGLIDFLYHAPDYEMPPVDGAARASLHPAAPLKLELTKMRATPPGVFKPSREVLDSIIKDLGAEKAEVIYVGDKKTKDMVMAERTGVTSVHAAYGEVYEKPEYNELRRVTHWTDEEVRKEQEESKSISANFSLKSSFSELLALFRFVPYAAPGAKIPAALLPSYVEAWKKTVDVQMHFNDLELRIRNFAITVLGALLGGAALTMKDQVTVKIAGYHMPAAALLTAAAIVPWVAFYAMDRFWYHRLLIGSVKHGMALEDKIGATVRGIGLTSTIGRNFSEDESNSRMKLFYRSIFLLLVALTLALAIGMGMPASSQPQNNANGAGATQQGKNADPTNANDNPSNKNDNSPNENDNSPNGHGNSSHVNKNGNSSNANTTANANGD